MAASYPFKPYYIYALVDPRDDAIRYVGLSYNPRVRLATHSSSTDNPKLLAWIKELQAMNAEPRLRILEVTFCSIARFRERHWTLKVLSEGHNLLAKRDPLSGPFHSPNIRIVNIAEAR